MTSPGTYLCLLAVDLVDALFYLPKIEIYDNDRSHGKTSHCNCLLVKITLLWTQCGTNQSVITRLVYSNYLKPGKKSILEGLQHKLETNASLV